MTNDNCLILYTLLREVIGRANVPTAGLFGQLLYPLLQFRTNTVKSSQSSGYGADVNSQLMCDVALRYAFHCFYYYPTKRDKKYIAKRCVNILLIVYGLRGEVASFSQATSSDVRCGDKRSKTIW